MAKRGRSICKTLKKVDLFKQEITLTYNGSETFRTSFGTTITVIMVMGMLSMLLFNLITFYA
jgi:hypothetical protein